MTVSVALARLYQLTVSLSLHKPEHHGHLFLGFVGRLSP